MMKRSILTGQRLVAVFLLGCVLFNYPVIALFNKTGELFDIPLLYLFLFGAWALLIGLMAWVIEHRRNRMLQGWVIASVSFAYLGVLFAIAYFGDKRADAGRSVIANPTIYALSLAVYCTTWTFYGSVGRAAATGIGFLPIYLGPTLMAGLWWFVMLKIIRISKANRITSIADFVSSRYGKSQLLGGLVTIIAVVGIVPYISLQLKAVSNSFTILLHYPEIVMPARPARSRCCRTARSTSP
jgi:hypothetical protein